MPKKIASSAPLLSSWLAFGERGSYRERREIGDADGGDLRSDGGEEADSQDLWSARVPRAWMPQELLRGGVPGQHP